MRLSAAAFLAVLAFVPQQAWAARIEQHGIETDKAPAIDHLLQCRNIADAGKRLICFDGASADLGASIDRNDVVVVNREQVRAAKHSLFGFALPDLGIFRSTDKNGNDKDDQEIAAVVKSAHIGNDGWVINLDNGATWRQTDSAVIARAPRPGDSITIERATFGSYIMKVGKQPGVKARRES